MELQELTAQIPNFAQLSHAEKIRIFGWYLHVYRQRDRFDAAAIRACYDELHLQLPANVNPYLAALAEKKDPDLLKDKRGYRLTGPLRTGLDTKYGKTASVVIVEQALAMLPNRVNSVAERLFLAEALICYRNKAFRAAIVMAWNLAYDHLLDWILADHSRLATFNTRIPIRFPRKPPIVITQRDDFEELKESEVIQVCSSAGLITGNINKILEEKLARRNIAAHPSTVTILQYQADDVITDLINNVILRLV